MEHTGGRQLATTTGRSSACLVIATANQSLSLCSMRGFGVASPAPAFSASRAGGSRSSAVPARVPLRQQRRPCAPPQSWGGFGATPVGSSSAEPLASSAIAHERLSKLKALAIFSSDNLSSSAYATEEILLVLILAGSGALHLSLPIACSIAALAAIVAVSYRQLVRAYPGGGGAYAVTKENLGVNASLLTGATLFVDYILTVAVSTAAGVAAMTAALPELHAIRVELALGFVALLTLGNLRGIREAGSLFAIPSYVFIFSFGGMLVVGVVRLALGHDLSAGTPIHAIEEGRDALTGFLLLRAFASGAAALTGIEAIADGVPSFKAPEAKNAATTLTWMAAILASFFLGATFLATQLHIIPSESITVVAQIAEAVFGRNVLFYLLQVSTAMILVLAANTAFAGLPTLASVMARDHVMPQQFAFRGDRLAFSNGILVLGVAASVVLVAFHAETHKIIPLYALGVFLAFTLSQAAMVLHWRKDRSRGWKVSLAINATGAAVTGVVFVIVVLTKFLNGAWLSLLGMGLILYLLGRIRDHYRNVRRQIGDGMGGTAFLEDFYRAAVRRPQIAIVPVEKLDASTLRAIAYARAISADALAIHVTQDLSEGEKLRASGTKPCPRCQW
jgi:amino acid transporter